MRYQQRILALFIGILLAIGGGYAGYVAWSKWAIYELPKGKIVFSQLRPHAAVEITDYSGNPLHYFYHDDLVIYRPLSRIAPQLKDFVLMLEDAKFFLHGGFDVEEIKNSIADNLDNGKVKRGGSTITQQLAKNLFLGKERTWVRKFFEVPWTLKLEQDLSKEQILELYLNIIEWGPGIRGAEAASRHYFDKPALELSLGQAMYLALIIPNPVRFDLFENPHVNRFLEKKKRWLVDRLVEEQRIPEEEKESYLATTFDLVPPAAHVHYPLSHTGNYLGRRDSWPSNDYRMIMEKHLKESQSKLRSSVETTLDATLIKKLSTVELIASDFAGPRYLVMRENGLVRAIRNVEANRDLDPNAISSLCGLIYVCSYDANLEWKNFAP